MNSNLEDFRDALIGLCEKALQGDLSIEKFIALWPKEISQTELVMDLFDDLEDGVEHFPGHLLSGKKDHKLWSTLHESYKLRVDLQLLASGLSEECMLALRKVIFSRSIDDKKEIEKLIHDQKSIQDGTPSN